MSDRDLLGERLKPDEPLMQPVACDARGHFRLRSYKAWWAAKVIQKRAKSLPFISLAAHRRWEQKQGLRR